MDPLETFSAEPVDARTQLGVLDFFAKKVGGVVTTPEKDTLSKSLGAIQSLILKVVQMREQTSNQTGLKLPKAVGQ